MRKLGKKVGFDDGTLIAFACSCNCFLCGCTSCKNCNTVPNATGLQITSSVNNTSAYNKSFGPMTIMG